MDVWNCRKENVVMGVLGRGARGFPSSSTDGRGICKGCGSSWPSIWPWDETLPGAPSEFDVGERRCRKIGGGTASSLLEASESGCGEVGESGG